MRSILTLLTLLLSTDAGFSQARALKPGDQVQVRPMNPGHPFSSILNLRLTVTPEGRLEDPNLGISCDVMGLEPADAKAVLRAEIPRIEGEAAPQLSVLTTRQGTLLANQHAVTLGGQVRNPGPIEHKPGMTLQDVVDAAGGVTAFGASNRLRLFRDGKLLTYDLRNPEHAKVTVTRYDVIEIPRKTWIGR